MLLNIGSFPPLAERVSRDPALVFVSGILLFGAGLAIVRIHNRWTNGWPMLVTVLGWLFVLGGLARILFQVSCPRKKPSLSLSEHLWLDKELEQFSVISAGFDLDDTDYSAILFGNGEMVNSRSSAPNDNSLRQAFVNSSS